MQVTKLNESMITELGSNPEKAATIRGLISQQFAQIDGYKGLLMQVENECDVELQGVLNTLVETSYINIGQLEGLLAKNDPQAASLASAPVAEAAEAPQEGITITINGAADVAPKMPEPIQAPMAALLSLPEPECEGPECDEHHHEEHEHHHEEHHGDHEHHHEEEGKVKTGVDFKHTAGMGSLLALAEPEDEEDSEDKKKKVNESLLDDVMDYLNEDYLREESLDQEIVADTNTNNINGVDLNALKAAGQQALADLETDLGNPDSVEDYNPVNEAVEKMTSGEMFTTFGSDKEEYVKAMHPELDVKREGEDYEIFPDDFNEEQLQYYLDQVDKYSENKNK